MGVTTKVDIEQGLVIKVASGAFTADDVMGSRLQMLGDPAYRPEMNILWDMREASPERLTSESLRALVERIRSTASGPWTKAALVVSKDAMFGTSRMFQSMAQDSIYKIMVFREMDEALRWLKS